MLTAGLTQPLAAPWRRVSNAARLHIGLERVASLVVEDRACLVPQLDARVFDLELVARLILTTADGSTLEKRVVRTRGDDAELFARRVRDTAEWATEQHPGIAIALTHDVAPIWTAVLDAVHELRADLDDRISRAPVPREVNLDRRPRV